MTTLTDISPLTRELRAAVRRYARLAESAADSSKPLKGSAWTIRDSIAHVASVAQRYSEMPNGTQRVAGTPADLPALNAADVEALGGYPVGELLGLLENGIATMIRQVERSEGTAPEYRFHGGELIAPDVALGVVLGELVVHGWDMARALHRSWPITREQVSLIWSAAEQIMPVWVDPAKSDGHGGAYQFHIGDGSRHVMQFTNGKLRTELGPGRHVDCHVGGSPVALLLTFYGRLSPLRAGLTGRTIAWGRRPWLAMTLSNLFYPA